VSLRVGYKLMTERGNLNNLNLREMSMPTVEIIYFCSLDVVFLAIEVSGEQRTGTARPTRAVSRFSSHRRFIRAVQNPRHPYDILESPGESHFEKANAFREILHV
jgi:hypothetical protein